MARDTIIDTADQNEDQEQPTDADGDVERVKLTQRMPKHLVQEVHRVQSEYELPSRNAAINFIVKQGISEL